MPGRSTLKMSVHGSSVGGQRNPPIPAVIRGGMGEHRTHRMRITQRPRIARKSRGKQTAEAIGRRLLEIIVYDICCRIGGTLTLNEFAEAEIGDWKMPECKMACTYGEPGLADR
jgi:hypothetical protein